MNDFEDELRTALGRTEPSADFAGRVIAAARRRVAPRRRGWAAAAIAACLALFAGGFEYRQYQGRKAKQELLLALELAGGKLRMAHEKVADLNRRTIP
ncbi:MAG TPA: hypothetical protein VL285_19735 [Bryobacteraceae bacterium]|jgi:hypothetical protein|nr:hypothetical protein [Bryobacteraceae bacterium]